MEGTLFTPKVGGHFRETVTGSIISWSVNNPWEVQIVKVYYLNTNALEDTNRKRKTIIKKILGIQHQQGPGNIDVFHLTGIKNKNKVNLSCITYKGNKFNSHDYNNKEASFLNLRKYKDIIKYHCIRHGI